MAKSIKHKPSDKTPDAKKIGQPTLRGEGMRTC